MGLSFGLGLPPAPKKGVGVDARYGIDIFAARSVGQTRFRNGLRSSSSLTDIATVTRATTAWGVDQAGVLSSFAAGQPVVNTAGLAVWEARTNVLTYSQDFTQAAWVKQGSAAALGGQFTAPDGTLTGSTVAAGATSNSGLKQNITAATQRYSKTLYVGAGTSSRVLLGIYDVTGGVFVPVTARIVSGPGTLSGTTLIWLQGLSATALTRVEIVSNAAITGSHHVYIYPDSDNSGGSQTIGNTIRLWGAQLEVGASASPYIPTTTTAVTRNADQITEAVNIPVGQAFTVTAKVVAPTMVPGDFPYVFSLFSADLQDTLEAHFTGSSGYFSVTGKSANIASGYGAGHTFATATPAGSVVAVAISVSGPTVTWSINGGVPSTWTYPGGAFPQKLTTLGIGVNPSLSSFQFCSTIRDLNIAMRAYSSAELQAASDVSLVWDEDYTTQTYRYVGAPYATVTDLPLTTFTRATGGYGVTAGGALAWFGSGALRATDAGLTVEGQATNLLQNSGLAGGATPTNWAVGIEDGTGSVGASSVIPANANRTCTVGVGNRQFISQTISLAANTTYTVSIDVEAFSGTPGGYFAYATSLPAGASSTLLAPPTSTGRKTFTITTVGTAGTAQIRIGLGVAGGATGAGSVTWSNPQVEAGTVTTSRITTPVGGTATRNADTLVTADTVISPTIVAEITIPPSGPAYYHIFTHDDGTVSNRVKLYLDRVSMRIFTLVSAGGVNQNTLDLGVVTAGATYKIAMRTATGDFAASKNGAACVTSAAGTLPSVTTFRVGKDNSGGEWGPGIRKIKRYSVAKTNAELQTLST